MPVALHSAAASHWHQHCVDTTSTLASVSTSVAFHPMPTLVCYPCTGRAAGQMCQERQHVLQCVEDNTVTLLVMQALKASSLKFALQAVA